MAGTALDLNKKVSQLERDNQTLVAKLPPAQKAEVMKMSPQIFAGEKLGLPPSQVQKLESVIQKKKAQ